MTLASCSCVALSDCSLASNTCSCVLTEIGQRFFFRFKLGQAHFVVALLADDLGELLLRGLERLFLGLQHLLLRLDRDRSAFLLPLQAGPGALRSRASC